MNNQLSFLNQKSIFLLGRFKIYFCKRNIGAISLYPEADDRSSAELGWTVNKKYWKRGICTEAARALVKNVNEKLGINLMHCLRTESF